MVNSGKSIACAALLAVGALGLLSACSPGIDAQSADTGGIPAVPRETPAMTPAPFAVTVIRGASLGARADSLFYANVLDVPPDATFAIEATRPLRAEAAHISLMRVSGDEVAITVKNSGKGLHIQPRGPLTRGCMYRLTVHEGTAAASGEILSEPVSVDVAVARMGLIAAFETDLDVDGAAERVLLYSDGRVAVVGDGEARDMVVPGLKELREGILVDLDRDGRDDVVLAGISPEGSGVLVMLTNTSTEGLLRLSSASSAALLADILHAETPMDGMGLPVAVRALDLGRDGVPDLAVLTLDGSLVTLRSPLSPARNAGVLTLSRSIGASMGLETADVDGDGYAEAVLSGTRAGAIVHFGRDGVPVSQDIEVVPAAGAGLMPVRLASGACALLGRFPPSLTTWRDERGAWIEDGWRCDECANAQSLLCADSDGDSRDDLFVARNALEGCVIHRFRQFSQGFDDTGDGCVLGDIGAVNALALARGGNCLLVCSEDGLIEVGLDEPSGALTPNLDSRVIFRKPRVVGVLPPLKRYVLGDFDADGRLDVAGFDQQGRLGVWFNDIDRDGGLNGHFPEMPAGCTRLFVADPNRDGAADLFLLGELPGERRGVLLLSRPDRTFASADDTFLLSPPADTAGAPVLADFNGDGWDDLFWPAPSGAVSFGDRTRFHQALPVLPAPADEMGNRFMLTGALLASRFAGLRPDVVAVGEAGGRARMAFFENRLSYDEETPGFAGRVLPGAFARIESPVSGIFEAGHMGVAALTQDGQGAWHLMLWPDPASERVIVLRELGANIPRDLQTIDVDGDGDDDLAFVERGGDDFLTLLVADGLGAFSEETMSSASLREAGVGAQLHGARLVDLNGDGYPDLLAQTTAGDVFHGSSR